MEFIYEWGLEVIRQIQQFQSPFLTGLMKVISFFGDPIFYFILVLLLYWCVDSRAGFRAGLVIVFSGALNTAIKETLQIPRPFVRDESVFIAEESGYSTPSGHSQGSASFYPVLARDMLGTSGHRRARVIVRLLVAVLVPLLIGFSRIYLGVHYPSDVFFGLTLGFLTSVGVMLFWNPVARCLGSWPASVQMLAAALVVFALNHFSRGHTSLNGVLFGFLVGRIFWNRSKRYWDAVGTLMQLGLRLLLGVGLTGLVFLFTDVFKNLSILLRRTTDLVPLMQFIQFALTSFTAVYLCPMLFVQFNLALYERPGER